MQTSLAMYTLCVFPILFCLFIVVASRVTITNVKCNSADEAFIDFEYCYIKAVNRSYKYISFKAKLHKAPVDNITVGVNVQKRANGYRPFLYNFEFDGCKFMKERKNPLMNYFYGFFENTTNMNNTCPYDHDIIMEKLDSDVFNTQLTKTLPVPEGEYAVLTTWKPYNKLCANVTFYVTLSS